MENRTFWIVVVVIVIAVAALLLEPTVQEQLAPEVESAWVAIEVADRGLAEVGPIRIEPGTPFQLHAVVGARERSGELLYYTQAQRLILDGEEIPADRLRTWDRRKPIKLRWYTVEGRWPFLPLELETGIAAFQMQPFLRSDWPLAWSIPGEIDAANDDHIETDSPLEQQLFGIQRYQVRFELYRTEDELVPEQVIRSWGVDELRANIDHFPTVEMGEPGPLGAAMRVFGLTQLEIPTEAAAEVSRQVDELARNRIAYSRATMLRDLLADADQKFSELSWQSVDLAGDRRWGESAGPGDLLRVGDRWVVLYEDRGEPGVLDYQDLCFDFVQGAEVRELAAIFSGEGQAVEHARVVIGSGGQAPERL